MTELSKHEIQSPEMQEVMTEIPGAFLRWGLLSFFIIIMAIIIVSYFINYPNIVTAAVTITTYNSPTPLTTKSGGKIYKLFVRNEENIIKKQLVALIENTAKYSDVKNLDSLLEYLQENIDWQKNIQAVEVPFKLSLGEIQNAYSQFITNWQQYKEYLRQAYLIKKIEFLNNEFKIESEYSSELLNQKHLAEEDLRLALNSFNRDSILFTNSSYSISVNEFEKSKQTLLLKKSSFSSLRTSIILHESGIMKLMESKLDLEVQLEKEINQHNLELDEAFQSLKVALDQWKEKFLIESPINGKVTFTSFWNENQVIKAGDILATVIPSNASRIIVRAGVPPSGLGRVKVGQEVNIKLSGFPYLEFGVIKGKVSSISLVPEGELYIAEIELINGMVSTYKIKLNFVSEMTGTADIITENSKLIYRFIGPLKNIL